MAIFRPILAAKYGLQPIVSQIVSSVQPDSEGNTVAVAQLLLKKSGSESPYPQGLNSQGMAHF